MVERRARIVGVVRCIIIAAAAAVVVAAREKKRKENPREGQGGGS